MSVIICLLSLLLSLLVGVKAAQQQCVLRRLGSANSGNPYHPSTIIFPPPTSVTTPPTSVTTPRSSTTTQRSSTTTRRSSTTTPRSSTTTRSSPTPQSFVTLEGKIGKVHDRLVEVVGQSYNSWELGTATEAFLEYSTPNLSVFEPHAFPPPESSAGYNIGDVMNIVGRIPPDSYLLWNDGSAGDPASLGVAVLLANWTRPDKSSYYYADRARNELSYLLNDAPRSASGAISHRSEFTELWSDFIYMAPPFIAYYAIADPSDGKHRLLKTAYDQCRLYRDALRDDGGLWRHTDTFDGNHWATGNGWAAAGMLRVRETIRHSDYAGTYVGERGDLTRWIREILDGAMTYQQPDGTLLNVIDANPRNSFPDRASTALLASVAYRIAKIDGSVQYLPFAEKALDAIISGLDDNGWLHGTTDPLSFYAPLDGGSPEGQAFVLLLYSAIRDQLRNG